MKHRFRLVSGFLRHFFHYATYVWSLIVFQTLLVLLGGAAIAWLEEIKIGDAIYFAFVTAFTIGYGDIAPATVPGRIVSIVIGFNGLVLGGLSVAIATQALATTIKDHIRDQETS